MKKIFAIFLAILLTTSAYADGRHERSHEEFRGHESHGDRGNWIIPGLIGGLLIYDATRPQVYVQPPPAVYYAPTPQVPVLYYCPTYQAYYPNVTSCPVQWLVVQPQQ